MKKKKMRLAESSGGGAAAASGPVKIPGPAPSAATLPAPQYEGKPPEECRSGDLPHGEYHQAEKIGAGSYGAISAVYDDDGELFALKVFDEGDDSSVDIGTLREMSMLRLLRGDLAHPFIVQAHDFYISQKYSSVCMVMPKAVGSVKDVLLGKLRLEKNGGKPRVAYQLLSALAYLHDNGIMHRDVKPDNVLLNANMEPVLCDFSLATFSSRGYAGPTHSGDVGTAVYMAPEVYRKQPYDQLCDAYSAGVLLLEVFQGARLGLGKDKQAQKLVAELRGKLPQRPIGDLLRGLTAAEPAERLSCRDALTNNTLMQSRGGPPPIRLLSLKHAMDGHIITKKWTEALPKKMVKAVSAMELSNPMTPAAALVYLDAAKEIDPDVEFAHCLLLASKVYEPDQFDFEDPEDLDEQLGDLMATAFDIDNYNVDENTIIEAMDFNVFVFNP